MPKLQPAIAVSTMEAGCAALSAVLRPGIPLLGLAQGAAEGLAAFGERVLAFQSTAHEDSQGALNFANLEEGRSAPRPKLCAARLHWLKALLHRPSKGISASFAGTSKQKADMLAKAPASRSLSTQ